MSKARARCRACGLYLYLKELIRAPFLEGHCPNCGRPLAADETQTKPMLLSAARAVHAHDELIEAVRALVGMPGNLELVPHTFVRELISEVDWEAEIAGDRDLILYEVQELERHARAWAKLVGEDEKARRSEMLARFHRVSGLLHRLASRVDQPKEAAAMEAAAARLDELASSMTQTQQQQPEGRPAHERAMEALDSARESVDGTSSGS